MWKGRSHGCLPHGKILPTAYAMPPTACLAYLPSSFPILAPPRTPAMQPAFRSHDSSFLPQGPCRHCSLLSFLLLPFFSFGAPFPYFTLSLEMLSTGLLQGT